MHKPESVLENRTHKILWDFEMQTDHLNPDNRPDQVLVEKKKRKEKMRTCYLVGFAIPVNQKSEINRKRIDRQMLGPYQRTKKYVNDGDTNGVLGTVSKSLEEKLEELESRGWLENINNTGLLRSAWEESWKPEETCYQSDSIKIPSANAGVKDPLGAKWW